MPTRKQSAHGRVWDRGQDGFLYGEAIGYAAHTKMEHFSVNIMNLLNLSLLGLPLLLLFLELGLLENDITLNLPVPILDLLPLLFDQIPLLPDHQGALLKAPPNTLKTFMESLFYLVKFVF